MRDTENSKQTLVRRLAQKWRRVHYVWFGGGIAVVVGAVLLFQAIFPGDQGAARAVPANFVYRQGAQLYLNGKPYKFAGSNNMGFTGCQDGYVMSQSELDRYFSQLGPQNVTRFWAFQHLGPNTITNIERVVKTAEKYNTKVVPTLQEGAEHCGAPDYTVAYYQSGYKSSLLSWVDQLVSRPALKNSPAIAFWEVSNEPMLRAGGGNPTVLKDFLGTVATRIKKNDPNHLVGSGTIAPWQYSMSGKTYADVHSNPAIDLISLHEYDYAYNNGQGSSAIVSPHFAKTKEAGSILNKPTYIGEMGIALKSGTITIQKRGEAAKQKLDGYYAAGVNGVLHWALYADYRGNIDKGNVSNNSSSAREPMFNSPVINAIAKYSGPNFPKVETKPTTTTPTPTTPAPSTPTPSTPVPTTTSALQPGTYNDSALTCDSKWERTTGDGKYEKDDRHTKVGGAACTVAFTGTNFDLYVTKDKHHGQLSVSIDGGAATTVDTYSPSRKLQVLAYSSPRLADGTHTATIRSTGTKSSPATGIVVALDKVVIAHEAAVTVPAPATGLVARNATATSVDLSWTAPASEVHGYVVSRDGIAVAQVTSTTTKVTGLSPDTTYTFSVLSTGATGTPAATAATIQVRTAKIVDRTAPTVPGNVNVRAVSATQATISWAAASDNVGVTGYAIYRDGTRIGTVTGAARSFGVTGLKPATRYGFSVSAIDGAQNQSAQSARSVLTMPRAAGTYNDSALTCDSNWNRSTGNGKFAKDDRHTSKKDAACTVTFAGTNFDLYVTKDKHHGELTVSIDNAAPTTVDTFSRTRKYQQLVYSSPKLTNTVHTVTIRAAGTKNKSATGSVVALDKFTIKAQR